MKHSFLLVLEWDDSGPRLRFEGNTAPDYRRWVGLEREALRAFMTRREASKTQFFFDADGVSAHKNADKRYADIIVRHPDEQLLDCALTAGILRTAKNKTITNVTGRYQCALQLKTAGAAFDTALVLLNEDGEAAMEEGPLNIVSPRRVLQGTSFYTIEDLGPFWNTGGAFNTRIKKSDISSYLSLMLSRFSNLTVRYTTVIDGADHLWQTRFARPIIAQPALLFMEIDAYEYLHVRPVSFLRDFPPEFLENEEIVTAVRMDEADKVFTVSEIIFPEPSDELFRVALAKSTRNLGGKAELQKQVYEENGRFIIAPDFAKLFFGEHIFELSAQFVLLETRVLASYKVSFSKPRLRLSLSSGIDFLSGNADIEFEGGTYSFSDFMNEYKNAECITLADGTRSFPDKRTMDKLDRLLKVISGNAVELSFFDIPLLLSDDSIEVDGAAWEKARPFFEEYNTIAARQGTWGIQNGELRSYQLYGVRWLEYLRHHAMGACLADEMGLGKTVQVIALLRALAASGEKGVCLILCPKSVVYNWASELNRFAPELSYIVHYGSERNFDEMLDKVKTEKELHIVLSTYATLRRDIEAFLKLELYYAILDESQNIKNLTTQTANAVMSLKARYRLAMSGTPIENNLSDLYSLFRFLNPLFFGSSKNFNAKYLVPIQERQNEDALRDLKARTYPFILRRLKRDVLRELPQKTEEVAYIELDNAQLELYHRRRLEYKKMINSIINTGAFAKSSILIFKALSELRRLATVPEAEGEYEGPSAKRQYLVEQITNLVENGHKCLVFANFLAGVELVSQDLEARGIANLTMTGATSNRQALVRSFQTDPAIKAFIMTLKTGGTGINLTAADYIFIMDPWWNSAAEAQAVDRSHRIGQINPVFCYRLIARDTIEERILELQTQKRDLAGALLSDDTSVFKSLSEEDISFLIGKRDE